MIGVLIIPTGIGCEIGGHSGDANPVAKLLASVCDTLILHPNVVNASDINEMPENCLYVEGSMLDRFLEGKFQLRTVRQNRILVAVNPPIRNHTINAVAAARVTIGIDVGMVELNEPLKLIAKMKNGIATGRVTGWRELVKQISDYSFDALAITTGITIDDETMIEYFRHGGVNPIGAVEAIASKLVANAINKPVAHAPFEETGSELWNFNEVVDPRIAPEMISTCFLHCVLKGLHKAPRIGGGLSVDDVDCLITPVGCVGRPHKACLAAGIPIIAVRENKTALNDPMPDSFKFVGNYWEAAGYIVAMKAGVHPGTVRRPLTSMDIGGKDD